MANITEPLFTIGVPTYNRKQLLKETLLSLLGQTYQNFEILIGNDYPDEQLDLQTLEIEDPRVRIINHPQNLGELENMNALISEAKGKYFSWQFDDDPCSPFLLSEIYLALERFQYPCCVFSSFVYIYGAGAYRYGRMARREARLLSGAQFLRAYLSGELKALGCCGFYDVNYLNSIGGAKRLSGGFFALHSEYLLLISAGLLPQVAYIDSALVSSRIHAESWTRANTEVELFKEAGVNLLKASLIVLCDESVRSDFEKNLLSILRSIIGLVIVKGVMSKRPLDSGAIENYRSRIIDEFSALKDSETYSVAMSSLNVACSEIPWYVLKARLKMITPLVLLKYAHLGISYFARSTRKTGF